MIVGVTVVDTVKTVLDEVNGNTSDVVQFAMLLTSARIWAIDPVKVGLLYAPLSKSVAVVVSSTAFVPIASAVGNADWLLPVAPLLKDRVFTPAIHSDDEPLVGGVPW